MCFALGFYESLLGLLNPVDKFTWKHLNFCDDSLFFVNNTQARRQGEFEGVRSNPLFGLQKILYTPLILSVLPFEIGPVASMLLRITAVHTTSAECARVYYKLFTPLR